jgi:hypothetical protein
MHCIKLPPVKRGDTWRFQFTWKSNNEPIDLSGCTGAMQVRVKRTGALVATASLVEIDGPTGTVNVTFNASSTANAPLGFVETDLQITYPDNTVQSSDTMQFTVEEDITHA